MLSFEHKMLRRQLTACVSANGGHFKHIPI